MGLITQLKLLVKAEIQNDPDNRGYAGKTNAEIMAILNAPYTVQQTVDVFKVAPINRIFEQIAHAPNAIDEADVQAIKNS
jgi:hypothetical protein